MVSKIVDITGRFLDIGGRPLSGAITIDPLPPYILVADEKSLYSGGITKPLDAEGNLSMRILSNPEWEYQISFDLTAQGDRCVDIKKQIIKIPSDSTVPQLLAVTLQTGSYDPVVEFVPGGVGEVVVSGAVTDPSDPGAILLNIPT